MEISTDALDPPLQARRSTGTREGLKFIQLPLVNNDPDNIKSIITFACSLEKPSPKVLVFGKIGNAGQDGRPVL